MARTFSASKHSPPQRTKSSRKAAKDATERFHLLQRDKGSSHHRTNRQRSKRARPQGKKEDVRPSIKEVLSMQKIDELTIKKEDSEEYEVFMVGDCAICVPFGMDPMGDIDSHEYWRIMILSIHSEDDETWVVGAWFYAPSHFKDIKLNPRDKGTLARLGNTELILSNHQEVINGLTIQDKCRVHRLDDTLPTGVGLLHSSWFYRMEMDFMDDGMWRLKGVNRHCTCDSIYSPVLDDQRYCKGCKRWFDVRCIRFARAGRPGPLASLIQNAPISRGWYSDVPDSYNTVGTGRLVKKSMSLMDKEGVVWENVLGQKFIDYIKRPCLYYKCPQCATDI